MNRRSAKSFVFVAALLTCGVYFMHNFDTIFSTQEHSLDDHTDQIDVQNTESRTDALKRRSRAKTTLVIMTQTRSGSSYAGEIFAAANRSLYLYEPLYAYGTQCKFPNESEALLKQLLSCDFTNLNMTNSQAFEESKFPDGGSCLRHAFCFTEKSTGLLPTYRKACRNASQEGVPKKCGYPLRPDILKSVCDSSDLLITKVTRVCTLDEMENIYRHLKRGNRDVYIVHLVRDLRSITSSLIKLASRKKPVSNPKGIVNDVINSRCGRQRRNLLFDTREVTDFTMMSDGRFMRMRYEDLSMNAVGETERIFKFMKLPLPPEVVSNINNYLHPEKSVLKQIETGGDDSKKMEKLSKQYGRLFGVVRDPVKILNEWRSIVPFTSIQEIQDKCGDVMKELGYLTFSSEQEMKDLSLPSFIART